MIVFNDETLHDVIAFLLQQDDDDDKRRSRPRRKPTLGSFPIVSRNGSPEAIEWIQKGYTTATLDYQLPEIGYLAASLLDDDDDSNNHNHRTGDNKNRTTSTTTTKLAPLGIIYDKTNIHEYLSWEVRAPSNEISLNVV